MHNLCFLCDDMGKENRLLENFVTVTKRLPLKARCVVVISLVVVVFELISGIMDMNVESPGMRNLHGKVLTGKSRERKDIPLDIALTNHANNSSKYSWKRVRNTWKFVRTNNNAAVVNIERQSSEQLSQEESIGHLTYGKHISNNSTADAQNITSIFQTAS